MRAKINRTLLYEIDLFDKKLTKKQLINTIQKEFLITLEQLEVFMKNMTKVYGLKSYITIIKIFMKIVLKKKKYY